MSSALPRLSTAVRKQRKRFESRHGPFSIVQNAHHVASICNERDEAIDKLGLLHQFFRQLPRRVKGEGEWSMPSWKTSWGV